MSWSSSPPSSSTLITALKKLEMESMKLVRLSTSSSMSNLNVLRIRLFKELKSLRFGCPNSIQTLMISHCKRLRNIEGLQHCCILEKLENKDCKELELEEEAEEGNTNDNSTTCRGRKWQELSISCINFPGSPTRDNLIPYDQK
ncbi:Disease resistance protein RPS2 [Bienertia sinuspersici]